MDQLEQLQLEWLLINASKELLSITKKNPNVTYADALKFAKENASKIFAGSQTGLGRKSILEKLYDKFVEEAMAKSLETGKDISPDSIIINRFEELERLLKIYPKNAETPTALRKEKTNLAKLISQPVDTIPGLIRITENNALSHDIDSKKISHIFINSHLGKFKEYLNKEDDSIFRVAVLHPDKGEIITGADLIYEQYNQSKDRVRIVAIQYKIWQNGRLYFSQAGNLLDQLDKMKNCFCDEKYCLNEQGESYSKLQFRLPYCTAFLRPTDKLQDPDKLTTTGYHVPICKIESMRKSGELYTKIELDDIKAISLKNQSFEEFFNANMVGSRWLKIEELAHLYQKSKLLEPSDKIILYAQNASKPSFGLPF
jgi:hypothetical protein